MAGLNKLIFLFKDNEKIDVSKTSVSFIFGDAPAIPVTPCVTNPKIDYSSNTFGSCDCNYINYADNTFEQRCVPPPPPNCTTDLYFDPTKTSFTYNCLCDTKTDSNDFYVDCSTGGGTGQEIDFGLIINNYGVSSSVRFSIDLYNLQSVIGFSSDSAIAVADMRLPQTYGYGFASNTVLLKHTFIQNDFVFGHEVKSLISYDDRNYFDTDINAFMSHQFDPKIIFDPYHEFNRVVGFDYGQHLNALITYDILSLFDGNIENYYGYAANSLISYDTKNKFEFPFNIYNGVYSTTLITYDDSSNKFDGDINGQYGIDVNSTISYAYPNPFLLPFIGQYGFDSTTLMSFGDINPFPTIIVSGHGFDSTFALNTKLIEDLIAFNKTADVSYGFSTNAFLLYNAYNPILEDGKSFDSYYGVDSTSIMRYSDDPYINNVVATIDFDSSFELDTQEGLYTLAADLSYGFDYNPNLEYTVGLSATGYYGIQSRILYIATLNAGVYLNPTMNFGHVLRQYDELDYTALDLMRSACCRFHKSDLTRIEMLDEPKYNRDYSETDVFASKVEIMLSTAPRFQVSFESGMYSEIIDNSNYLSVDFRQGVSGKVRDMIFDSSLDLVGGNFIVDQNEIKVEMTKPEDTPFTLYGFGYGYRSQVDLSIVQNYNMVGNYGHSFTFDMFVDSALRGNMIHGFQLWTSLGTSVTIPNTLYQGWESRTVFYEPTYDCSYGITSTVDELYTKNFVEFIDDGEVKNEYIHQNKNGDPDLTKPNGVSLEGYVYTHYIKGRCY